MHSNISKYYLSHKFSNSIKIYWVNMICHSEVEGQARVFRRDQQLCICIPKLINPEMRRPQVKV